MITFTPSKEFVKKVNRPSTTFSDRQSVMNQLYGESLVENMIEAEKHILKKRNEYLSVIRIYGESKQPWYQKTPILRYWEKWIRQLFNYLSK